MLDGSSMLAKLRVHVVGCCACGCSLVLVPDILLLLVVVVMDIVVDMVVIGVAIGMVGVCVGVGWLVLRSWKWSLVGLCCGLWLTIRC